MDPEQIAELQRLVAQARAAGKTDAEIDAALKDSGAQYNSIRALERAATARPPDRVGTALAPITQGLTFGFAGDILDALGRAGIAPEDMGEQHRQGLAIAREEHPILSAVGEIGGAIGGLPGRAGAGLLGLAMKGTKGPLTRAGAKIGSLFGPRARVTGGMIGSAGASTLAGAGTGAAEAGLYAAGSARTEGASPMEAVATGAGAMPLGALLGGATGAAVGGGQQLKSLFGRVEGRGTRVEQALREQSRVPSRGAVRGRVEATEQAKRAAFRMAEDQGTDIPFEITQFVASDPVALGALRRSGSQEARRVWNSIEKAREAQRAGRPIPEIQPLSFTLADDLRQDLLRTASAFRRRQPDASGKVPSAARAREAQDALDELESMMVSVPGFEEGIQLAALAGTQRRALRDGQKIFSKTVDEVQEAFASVPGGPEAREAFRTGMATRLIQQLRSGNASVKSFIEKAQTSDEMAGKLRIVLGGEPQFQAFMRSVSQEAAEQSVAKITQDILKYGGFMLLGSSIAGGIAGSIFGGN